MKELKTKEGVVVAEDTEIWKSHKTSLEWGINPPGLGNAEINHLSQFIVATQVKS